MTNATTEQLIAAKERIRALFAEGELPYVIHLGGGNEAKLIEIFNEIQPEDYVLVDIREDGERSSAGIPELKLGARFKVAALPLSLADPLVVPNAENKSKLRLQLAGGKA